MLVKELMTKDIVTCTPWDSARVAAMSMKEEGLGAIPVVSDPADPLLEGIITDRDLCCGVVAEGKKGDGIEVWELMTAVPVTCEPEYTLEECELLMQENQVRRIPVVDKNGRCIGILSQADIALHAPAAQVAETIREISKPSKAQHNIQFQKDYFYCGTLHEEDEILLLNRRRQLQREIEVVR